MDINTFSVRINAKMDTVTLNSVEVKALTSMCITRYVVFQKVQSNGE